MSDPEQSGSGSEGDTAMGPEQGGERPGSERDEIMDNNDPALKVEESSPYLEDLDELGDRFELCIEAVEELEYKRDSLIREITLLMEPKLEEIRGAHNDILKAYRLEAKVVLEHDSLRQEMQAIKRKLFQVTRECVACEYQLENQRHDVAQFAVSKEELESRAAQLSEELSSLRDMCTQRKEALLQRLAAPRSRRGSRYLNESRRLSAEFENFMFESRNILEAQYEPMCVRLLERTAASAKTLKQTQEEVNGLKESLRPLQEQASKLNMQNKKLEQQILLLRRKRNEEMLEFRGQMDHLETNIREMKIGVQLQQRRNRELDQLRSSLAHELSIYKGCLEIYGQLCKTEAKAE